MLLYIDLDKNTIVDSASYPRTVNSLSIKRRDSLQVQVAFFRNNTVTEISTGDEVGKIGVKSYGVFNTDFLTSSTAWTKTGTGTSTRYTFDISTNTTEIDTAFGTEEPISIAAMLEISWTYTGPNAQIVTTSTNTLPLTIVNDVIRGDEGIPTEGNPEYATVADVLSREAALGNPSVDGYMLVSTAAGVRSWVAVPSGLDGFEPDLGLPAVDGYILSSTAAGVRTWIPAPEGTGSTNTDMQITQSAEYISLQSGSGTAANITAATESVAGAMMPAMVTEVNKIAQKANLNVDGTRLISGGDVVQYSSTSISVSAGSGWFYDTTTGTGQTVSWDDNIAYDISTQMATGDRSYVAIDPNNPTVLYFTTSYPTDGSLRNYLFLAIIGHRGGSAITNVLPIHLYGEEVSINLFEMAYAVGTLNMSGNVYSAASTNLSIKKSSGTAFRYGINADNDRKNPHFAYDPEQNPVSSFVYCYRSVNSGEITYQNAQTAIIPGAFDDGDGTLGTVGVNEFTIQRIYYFPGARTTYVHYGQTKYGSLAAAEAAVPSEIFTLNGTFFDIASYRAALIVKGNCTDLSSATTAKFISIGKFGTGGGGAGGTSGGVDDSITDGVTDRAPSQNAVFDAIQPFLVQNRLINSHFLVDNRNKFASQTFTAGAALAYSVDRWWGACTGANVTGQRTANGRYTFSGAASVTGIKFGQRIESINSYDLANGNATLSVYLANSLLTSVTWTAYYATTTDAFGTLASPTKTQIATGTFTVNSTVSLYTTTIAIPAGATTGIEIVLSVGAQTSGTWTIGPVQLEAGSIATGVKNRFENIEQTLCSKYVKVIGGDSLYQYLGSGMCNSATAATMAIILPGMRAIPNFSYSGNWQTSDGTSTFAVTNMTLATPQSSRDLACINVIVASGLTQYRNVRVEANNSLASKIVLEAEI